MLMVRAPSEQPSIPGHQTPRIWQALVHQHASSSEAVGARCVQVHWHGCAARPPPQPGAEVICCAGGEKISPIEVRPLCTEQLQHVQLWQQLPGDAAYPAHVCMHTCLLPMAAKNALPQAPCSTPPCKRAPSMGLAQLRGPGSGSLNMAAGLGTSCTGGRRAAESPRRGRSRLLWSA